MKTLTVFQETANDLYAYAETWKKDTGKKIIGYFCSYTPEELIHAAGALPFRIFGTRDNIIRADNHLQTYCCSFARGCLDEALSGNLGFLDGTVFPHTCDTIQRLSDIWRLNAGFSFHFDVVLPVKLNTDSAKKYNSDVFKKFRTDIENAFGIDISKEKLNQSIDLYNNIRKTLTEIYTIRSNTPEVISDRDMFAIIQSSMVMDRDHLLENLTFVLEELKRKDVPAATTGPKKRLVLTGGICSHPDIYTIIESLGGTVVWDDLCTGARYFSVEISKNPDPVSAIADRYFERAVCPAKHVSNTYRGKNIVNIAKEYRADGVVFLLLTFCDPHGFDYPYLKEFLDSNDIPNLLIETDNQIQTQGIIRTKLETFLEMI